jgi:hypothetical protein
MRMKRGTGGLLIAEVTTVYQSPAPKQLLYNQSQHGKQPSKQHLCWLEYLSHLLFASDFPSVIPIAAAQKAAAPATRL